MATDIQLTDLTNGDLVMNQWEGTGVFDKLMIAVNKNIQSQYEAGRINGSDYANVYLGGLQSVLSQSIEFLLREKLTEAQIDDTLASVSLKQNQLDVDKNLTEAQLEQQWGYDVTRDADDNLVLGNKTNTGKIDKEKTLLGDRKETEDLNQILLTTEETIKEAQLLDIQKSTDVKERDMVEKELTGAKQRVLLDEEKETADLQQILLDKDATLKDEQIETQNKQQILLDTEEEIKQYEHDVLQVDQHNLTLGQISKLADEESLVEQQVLQVGEQRPELLTKLQEEIETAGKEREAIQSGIDKSELERKVLLMKTQLDAMVSLYSNRQLDNLTEIVTTETAIEELYNSAFKSALKNETVMPSTGITPDAV